MAGPAVVTAWGAPGAEPARRDDEPLFELVELMFFAYRDFVGDADRRLEALQFGRAHHRVLHFVYRHPGLTVAALLDILRITKQSLNRVMKDLIEGGLIEVRAGVSDRRRRLLHATPEGCALALDLARLQSERFRQALDALPAEARPHAGEFLLGLVDAAERPRVMDLVRGGTRRARSPRPGAAGPRDHAA